MFKKKHSEKTKQKISDALKGRHFSEERMQKMCDNHADVSGNKNPMFGRGGNKNPMFGKYDKDSANWKGGLTPLILKIRNSIKYSEWRAQIYQRDLFICQLCRKKSDGDLVAHHINRLAELIREHNINSVEEAILCEKLWDISNGQTLCKECHKKTNNYKNRKLV